MKIHREFKVIIGAAALAFFGSPCSHASKPPKQPSTVKVFKSLETLQCKGGGIPLDSVVSQLSDAGVNVLSSSCGFDGRVYAAMCGMRDGRIAIIEISSSDMNTSISLGFSSLSELKYAQPTSCH